QHRPHARRDEIGAEVLLVVPHECRDAVAVRHTQLAQAVSKLRRPRPELSVADVAIPIGGRRGDLSTRVPPRPAPQNAYRRKPGWPIAVAAFALCALAVVLGNIGYAIAAGA